MLRYTRLVSFAGLLTAAAWLGCARSARAEDLTQPTSSATSLGSHQRNLRLDLGVRAQFIESAGLDPFAVDDALPQVTLGASYAFLAQGRLSLAGAAIFDYGGSSAQARDNRASLDISRFALGPEVRYHVLRVAAVTLRVTPTLTRMAASLSSGVGSDLVETAWKAGVDATAGAVVELYGYASGESRSPRVWLSAEGGYGWTSPTSLTLSPESGGQVPQRLQPISLPRLSLSGPLFRITGAVSF
jgi:hypothetical protein